MDIELIDLDDERAVAEAVGAKAARLADARRRGLPALPGFVVLPGPGRRLVADLLPQVAQRGPHAVSFSLMERVPDEVDLTPAIERARALGSSLVARSSSGVEDDPVWSGAFSSFLDLQPEQLTTAVAGCWASTITRSVLEICENTGAQPADVCPAVLVQPMVEPQAAGTATYAPAVPVGSAGEGERTEPGEPSERGERGEPGERADGRVEIVAVWGSPAPLMVGWAEGWRATVTGATVTGPAVGEGPPGRGRKLDTPFPADWFRAVADLARAALDGAPSAIEWAVVDDRPVLLQARPAVIAAPREAAPLGGMPDGGGAGAGARAATGQVPEGAALLPGAVGAARAIARFGGPLGDELVLPWLLGLPAVADLANDAGVHGSGALDFDTAVEASRALVAEAMGTPPADAAEAAAQLLGRVANGDLGVLATVRPVDAGPARAVLVALAAAGRRLVDAGALAHPEQLWSLSAAEVRRLLDEPAPGDWHRHRHRTLRWQALLQQVIAVRGRSLDGDGVSPGLAAGPARRLSASRDLRRVVPGDIVVLHRPSPQLAPALWVASGLVAESGSGAAHLVEVARSLRVPAVVAVGSFEVEEGDDLLLVDGDESQVALLPGSEGEPTAGRQ